MVENGQLTGSILHGTYSLLRLIGEGGMGTVYEAKHLRLDRRFAVKVLHRKASDDPITVARFQREAQITSNLGSKHIVDVVDFNVTEGGVRYIVMEMLEGEDLETRIGRLGKLTLQQAAPIAEQIVAALYSAHRSGIVHRDLKPSNVFLCRQEEEGEVVKVLDFGISKILGDRASSITTENSLVGTPHYMAPEQIMDNEVDYRVDVWATGAIVYEMLAGLPPFHNPRIPTVFHKIVNEDPLPLSFYVKDLPDGLEAAVMHALKKDPNERPPSIRAFWRELADAAGVPYRDFTASWPETDGDPSYPSLPSSLAVTQQPVGSAETLKQSLPDPKTQPLPGTLTASTGETRPAIDASTEDISVSRRTGFLVGSILLVLAVGTLVFTRNSRDDARVDVEQTSAGNAPARDLSAFGPAADVGAQTPAPPDAAVAVVPDTTAVVATVRRRQKRARRTRSRTRLLVLQTNPSGATVTQDGHNLGKTPLQSQITTKATTLRVEAPGYEPRLIPVPNGTHAQRLDSVTLKPLPPATLNIVVVHKSKIVTALVYIDGALKGEAPLHLPHLRPGPHVIRARFGGMETSRKAILKPGETQRIRLVLPKAPTDKPGAVK